MMETVTFLRENNQEGNIFSITFLTNLIAGNRLTGFPYTLDVHILRKM